MAAGDSKLFNDGVLKWRNGDYNTSDQWAIVFVSENYTTQVDTDVANPQLSNFTVQSGGNVAAQYIIANVTMTRAGAVITFDGDSVPQIAPDAANPTAVRTALLVNLTTANDDVTQAYDMTADGATGTPPDLVNNTFTFNFGAAGINTSTNNNP